MKPLRRHRPGTPKEPDPPERLLKLTEAIADPAIVRSGVTTTSDGRWALYVTVPADVDVPVASVERQAEGFPVVYEAEPKEPPRAGPAYPADEGRTPRGRK